MREKNYKALTLLLGLLILILSGACNKSSQQTPQESSGQSSSAAPASGVKHYHLKGKIVSIDKRAKMANIDAEAIPGFMDAMTMPYLIKPEGELDKLHAGDLVTGDLVVQDDNSWLENITIADRAKPDTK